MLGSDYTLFLFITVDTMTLDNHHTQTFCHVFDRRLATSQVWPWPIIVYVLCVIKEEGQEIVNLVYIDAMCSSIMSHYNAHLNSWLIPA